MKVRTILVLVVVAAGILFAVRHRSLRQLKVEQVRLQHEVEQRSKAQQPPTQAGPAISTNSNLSAAEHSELLRLRGQIAGLRQELAQESNHLAALSRRHRPVSERADEPFLTPAQAAQKVSVGRQWGVALVLYADSHDGQLPAAMTDAAAYAGPAGTNDELELVRNGPLRPASNELPQRTILLREKKPWRGMNGRWSRTYVFADGHSEIARSDTSDFSEWEEKVKTR
jgi:hypothetical protein